MLLNRRYQSKLAAETVGTFALVFAGCGAVMVQERFPGAMASAAIPVVFGLAVAMMIYAVGHISGAHFNPAVTLAFAAAKRFPARQILGYWAAQFAGAVSAIMALEFLLPQGLKYGATVPAVPHWQALGWEVILTFFLMFVIISVATDARAVGTMAGAAIGAAVMLAAFVGGPVSGASMNPARTLAPALAQAEFSGLWIYFAGPMTGAVLAAWLYEWIRCESEDSADKTDAKGCC